MVNEVVKQKMDKDAMLMMRSSLLVSLLLFLVLMGRHWDQRILAWLPCPCHGKLPQT